MRSNIAPTALNGDGPVQSSLRDALRDACMPIHHRVERVVDGGCFFTDANRYPVWLAVMRDTHQLYHRAYEEGARALGLAPLSSALLTALDRDLGQSSINTQTRSLPPEMALGVAYVFEGSAMGARLLQKQLAQGAPVPTHYIDLLVATSRTRWPQTKEALSAVDGSLSAPITGAQEVFAHLIQAFTAAQTPIVAA